jgi:EAL domain-containing protein (putative c-di-GMP-specific phosphodiesterase class I)
MANSPKDTEIVKAVVGLGNVLGKTVIAEGIETAAQLSQLRALGCRYGQGQLLAPPLSPEMAHELLLTGVATASTEPVPTQPGDFSESATMH